MKDPSSESMLHHEIYKMRPDVNAIFHGHSGLLLKRGNLPTTKEEKAYGSIELVKEVSKILNKGNLLLMKNHGFLSLGKSMEEAGKLALTSLTQ